MPSERDQLLQRVYGRASRLWLTRRVAPVAAAVLVVVAGVVVIPRLGDDGRPSVQVAARDGGTTVPEVEGGAPGQVDPAAPGETTTTASPAAGPATTVPRKPGDPNQTVSTNAPPPGATTSTTRSPGSDPCRNNNGNDSCGQFRWASDPGPNAPLQFTITYSPQQPHAGQEVTFTVRVVDPDASPINACGDAYDDQPTFAAVGCAHTMECAANYGTWDVPPKQRGEATFTYKHAFVSAGEHHAEFHAESMQGTKSAGQCAAQPNPYASEGSGSVKVMVS